MWSVCIFFFPYTVQFVLSGGTMYSLENGATPISQDCMPRRQRQVQVSEVSIVCDYQAAEESNNNGDDNANGNYYNNNNMQRYSYTNKPTCLAGDLGKMAINCKKFFCDGWKLADSWYFGSLYSQFPFRSINTVSVKNGLPYNSTIYMSMRAFSHGKSVILRNRTDVCSYPNLGFVGNDGFYYAASETGSLCPLRADLPYLLLTSFTVPTLSHWDAYVEFVPDLVVDFYATLDESSPMVGCVETGSLARVALEQERANRGVAALFISIFCFMALFALCLYGYSRRREATEIFEKNRVASMIRRYRYRKENSSGSVNLVPSLSEGRPLGSMSSSHDPTRTRSECSRSERTISTSATAKKSLSGRSQHSVALLPPKEDVV
jgi:hypothetical protein